jgi:hypothetical protein
MWLLVLTSLSLSVEPAPDADVVVTRLVSAPLAAVREHLGRPSRFEFSVPTECIRKVEPVGAVIEGVGAAFDVTYLMEGWRRKLRARVSVAEARRIEWDHEGNRGFITRFSLTEAEGGTSVTAHTFLNAPPRPFQRYYFRRVQPAWKACYERFLDNVATSAGTSP